MVLLLAGTTSLLHSFAFPKRMWTATWGASQTAAYGSDSVPPQAFEGATLRQTVHISIGGSRLRLRISNVFGEGPLVLHSVQVGLAMVGKPGYVQPGSQTSVSFHGEMGVSVPAGAEYLSDPVEMRMLPLSDVSVTMMVERVPATLTFHSGSRATSFLLQGDHVADSHLDSAKTFTHWYFLSGIEVGGTPTQAAVVVALGDSITDGHGVTTDANERWTDVLARRFVTKGIGVVNRGIGGNRILQDGIGPNALARFDRDVLGTAGVRDLIVLEGINDLGEFERLEEHSQQAHDVLLEQIEGAFRQMVERAHVHGIRVYGGTLTPFYGSEYYHPSARSEADRQSLNRWIRTSGVFDQVTDFDALVRDTVHPERLAPEVDSGDHLHPGPAGYKRMGDGIALILFRK